MNLYVWDGSLREVFGFAVELLAQISQIERIAQTRHDQADELQRIILWNLFLLFHLSPSLLGRRLARVKYRCPAGGA